MPAKPKNWPPAHEVAVVGGAWRADEFQIRQQQAARLAEFLRQCPEIRVVEQKVYVGDISFRVHVDGDPQIARITWFESAPGLLYGYYIHSVTKDSNLTGLLTKMRKLRKRYDTPARQNTPAGD